jgi:hypothetical protein
MATCGGEYAKSWEKSLGQGKRDAEFHLGATADTKLGVRQSKIEKASRRGKNTPRAGQRDSVADTHLREYAGKAVESPR